MRDLTDDELARMTPEEKVEYARLRAAAKYTNPEEPGEPLAVRLPSKYIWGGGGTLVLLALAALTMLGREWLQREVREAPARYGQNQPDFRASGR